MPLGSYNTITVGITPTLIIAANCERKGVLIVNNGSVTMYIGPDSSITSANALPIFPGGSLDDSGLLDSFRGSIYGIVASGTVDARYWEWIQ